MEGSKILVVEDERITAEDIKSSLESVGYQVPSLVSSGEDAIEKAGEFKPDLVLMDIKLKGKMDGIAAASQIRLRYDIPVIYLTAYSDEYTVNRAEETEPSGYIIKEQTGLIRKPFEESELHTAIEITLHRHKMEKDHDIIFSAMLKNINDAVIATDDGGTIKLINTMAENLTGWKSNEAIGKDLTQVFKISDDYNTSFSHSAVENVLLDDNINISSKNGYSIPIKASFEVILNQNGDNSGFMLIFNHSLMDGG